MRKTAHTKAHAAEVESRAAGLYLRTALGEMKMGNACEDPAQAADCYRRAEEQLTDAVAAAEKALAAAQFALRYTTQIATQLGQQANLEKSLGKKIANLDC